MQAIDDQRLKLLPLSPREEHISQSLPSKLHAGECEAIALAQSRKAPLLSNDKRAINYSRKQGIRVLALTDILRLLWIRRIVSQKEVKELIQAMQTVEKLKLKKTQLDQIFAPRSRRKPRRRK